MASDTKTREAGHAALKAHVAGHKAGVADERNRPAIDRLYSAYSDLRADGWQDVIYAPKDGTEIEIIEMGSIGVHKAMWFSFSHDPLDTCGSFFSEDYPTDPVLWRPIKSKGNLAAAVDAARGGPAPPKAKQGFAQMAIERNVEVGGIEYFCPVPVAEAIDKYRAFYINSTAVTNLLDRAHCALRRIDAGDQTKAFPTKDLDAVSDAVAAIEEFCRERKLPLSEFGVRT